MGTPEEEAVDKNKSDHESVPLVEVKATGGADADPDANGGVESSSSTARKPDDTFIGLNKEELDKFAKDPFWRRLRLIIFVAFWIIWFGMLAAVIIIIIVSPKCPPRPERQFWQSPHYRLQIQSFAPDPELRKNSSVVGSLAGLKSRINYLREDLGINNYIIGGLVKRDPNSGCPRDFSVMDERYGSVEELKALTKSGRKKGYNFIVELDFSQADKEFSTITKLGNESFITDTGKGFTVQARDGQPAWKNFTMRAFNSKCPSLNVKAESVRQRLVRDMSVWLDMGVSGFLLTNAAYLQPLKTNEQDKFLFSEEAYKFVKFVRQFLNEESESRGRELALFVDPGDLEAHQPLDRLTKFGASDAAHSVMNVGMGTLRNDASQSLLKAVRSAHNQTVLSSVIEWPYLRRRGDPILTAISLFLPGVPIVYYGQEVGMQNVSGVVYKPPLPDSTDESQTPMQWANSPSAGWLANDSDKLDWLNGMEKRAKDIRMHNLQRLSSSGHPSSSLHLTRQMLQLVESTESVQWGDTEFLDISTSSLFVLRRKATRFPSAVLIANRDAIGYSISLDWPSSGTLKVMHSSDMSKSSYVLNELYQLNSLYVPPESVLVFVEDDGKNEEE